MKIWIAVLALAFSSTAFAKKPRVLMIINQGFFAPEYYEPREAFDQAGFHVTVAALYKEKIAPDRRNKDALAVQADITFPEVRVRDYDAITFAGGNGAWTDYFPNEDVHKILSEALGRPEMITALICSSTGLLAVANNFDGQQKPLAEGRQVTGYFRVEGLLRQLGKVKYEAGRKDQPHVVVDGSLITGRDPMSAQLFGETVRNAILKKIN